MDKQQSVWELEDEEEEKDYQYFKTQEDIRLEKLLESVKHGAILTVEVSAGV